MKITCVSDLHGYLPELPGGDLLLLAGDYTATGHVKQWNAFYNWLLAQDYRKKVYIGGNHDNFLSASCTSEETRRMGIDLRCEENLEYLWDNGVTFEGLRIWGSPASVYFPEVNPHAKFFMEPDSALKHRYDLIPDDTHILLTHTPPKGVLDKGPYRRGLGLNLGSQSLADAVERVKPLWHVFGHIHEGYGMQQIGNTLYINASHCDRGYEDSNAPITIEL